MQYRNLNLPIKLRHRSFALTAAALLYALPAMSLMTTAPALAADAAAEPAPAAPGELTLSGPDGTEFSFCPVMVKGGSGQMAGQKFVIGDPSGDFRTPPTAVVIGGGFTNGSDRYYYLGKTEVTNAQFKAVTGREFSGDPEHPVAGVTWFEVQNFIDALNRYFYEHDMKDLPKSGPFPAYVRLPTEEEWEFAARGGSAVDSTVFDADTPYDEEEELSAYEWFSGPSSSHNKIQKAGKLSPNPLGLHDMLGNVQEMTSTLYRVEYYQGRSGGFTARGGHYLTEEEDLSAARRSEEPYYLGSAEKGMKPNQKPTLGFRLALAAPIMTDNKVIGELEKEFAGYRKTEGAVNPAALSVADVSAQEQVPANDALARLDHLGEFLEKNGLAEQTKADLNSARAALRDMVNVRRKADEDSAMVWVKIACERGMYLSRNLRGLELARQAPTENLRRRAEQYAYNVNVGLESYSEIMRELAKLPKETVLAGFKAHTDGLQKKAAALEGKDDETSKEQLKDLTAQSELAGITRGHYERFESTKRSDGTQWSKDYLGQKSTGQ